MGFVNTIPEVVLVMLNYLKKGVGKTDVRIM